MAGQTDLVDYEDQKILPEYDFEQDDDTKAANQVENDKRDVRLHPREVKYRFRVPEAVRIEARIKNRYYYIGGVPLSQCQVETVPVIQSLQDDALLYEYSFIADQFCWLQDQKYPRDNPEWKEGSSDQPRYVPPLNPQLVKFFEHYMVCLVRRLDSIKRMKAKETAPEKMAQFGVVELRDYQRESYQFRIKLGRLRQLRLEGGGAITQQNYH